MAGGAGIQADIKTAAAHNVFATTAITALTAQNTVGVHGIFDVDAEFVGAQIDAVLDDIGADAIKIGMLNNAEVINKVADCLQERFRPNGEASPLRAQSHAALELKLILDPVMVSRSGDRLLDEGALDALKSKLLPLATVITPNIPEAEILTGMKIESIEDMCEAGEKLLSLYPHPSSL